MSGRPITILFKSLCTLFNLMLRVLSFPARWERLAKKAREPAWTPPADGPHQLWRIIEERRASSEPCFHLWRVVEQRRAQRQPERASEPATDESVEQKRHHPHRGTRVGRRVLVPLAIVTILIGAAGSFADWASIGGGTGTAVVGTVAHPITFTPGNVTAPLYPGGSGDVSLTVSNTTGFSLRIPSIVLDTSLGTGGFAASGCTVAQAQLTFPSSTLDNGGSGWDVPAGAGSYVIDLPNAVSMAPTAANACQNATFTVYLKVGP